MTAQEAKKLADVVNQDSIDHADGDLDHVLIEIQEHANAGDYIFEYGFHPSKDYSLVNEIRNQLEGLGYEVDIEAEEENGQTSYVLNIDWSRATED